jgi:hypothetical protein
MEEQGKMIIQWLAQIGDFGVFMVFMLGILIGMLLAD